jgi:replicative DNA helicase
VAYRDGGIRGAATGFSHLDSVMGGLRKGELVVVGARPAVGKTALALQIADAVAARGEPVAFFSLEMTRDVLSVRRLCAQSRTAARETVGAGSEQAWDSIMRVYASLARRPLFVDDTFRRTVSQMAAQARLLKVRKGALGLVVVDYMQLLRGDERAESRQVEVSGISRALKGLARELEVPVLALSQLSRAAEDRQGRPQLADLRESGAIEQDADVVVLLHKKDPEPGAPDAVEVIVAKNRNGATGVLPFRFTAACTRFDEDTASRSGFSDAEAA